MLFVHHHQRQVTVRHGFLEDGVRPDQNVDLARRQRHQRGFPRLALVAAGQHPDLERQPRERLAQRLVMLASEDFGRSQHRRLRPRLDRDQHRHRRHQRLARADVTLEQSQHRRVLREITLDLAHRPALRTGERVGQLEHIAQPPVTVQRPTAPLACIGPDQRHRQLVGEHLVITQPLPRLGVRRVGMDAGQRVPPVGPTALRLQPRLDPFGQVGRTLHRLHRQRPQPPRGDPLGQRIDRLALAKAFGVVAQIGVHDLQVLAVQVEATRHDFRLADGQQLLHPTRIAAEIDERDAVPGRVLRPHARRAARGGRDAVLLHGQRDGDHPPRIRHHQFVPRETVDMAGRQMKGDIDHARDAQAFERLGEAGPDAFQRRDLGEQRIEDIGTHD